MSRQPKSPAPPDPSDSLAETANDRISEAAETEAAPDISTVSTKPPEGANVLHKHQSTWTEKVIPERNAAEYTGNYSPDDPGDDFLQFIQALSDGDSYTVSIIREPDPMSRRTPGASFNRPCFQRERLGFYPFNPETFFSDIQAINKNSGGDFSIAAYRSNDREYVCTWRGTIGDPYSPAPANGNGAQALGNPNPRDIMIAALQEHAELRNAMIAAGMLPADGATPKTADDAETQAAKMFLKDGNVLATTMTAITQSMSNAITAAQREQNPSATDRIIDAISANPQLQTRLGDLLDKLVTRILPEEKNGNHPETDDTETEIDTMADAPEIDSETNHRILIEFLANACAANETISIDHEIFQTYKTAEPEAYELLLAGLKGFPLKSIIKTVIAKADSFGHGPLMRLVLQRPEGERFIAALQESAKAKGKQSESE